MPNGGVAPPTGIMANVVDSFSRDDPNSDASRTSAMEDLKRVATRYLCDPDSQVDTLHFRLSPSGSRRFRVMILVEVDNI